MGFDNTIFDEKDYYILTINSSGNDTHRFSEYCVIEPHELLDRFGFGSDSEEINISKCQQLHLHAVSHADVQAGLPLTLGTKKYSLADIGTLNWLIDNQVDIHANGRILLIWILYSRMPYDQLNKMSEIINLYESPTLIKEANSGLVVHNLCALINKKLIDAKQQKFIIDQMIDLARKKKITLLTIEIIVDSLNKFVSGDQAISPDKMQTIIDLMFEMDS